MRLMIIAEGDDGESRFLDGEITLAERMFAPPAPPLEVSDAIPAAQGMFCRFPVGWFGDWHAAPRRQYYVHITGELEVGVGDGEVRRLHPGDVVLLEDTTGNGHTTRVVSDVPVVGVFLQLPTDP